MLCHHKLFITNIITFFLSLDRPSWPIQSVSHNVCDYVDFSHLETLLPGWLETCVWRVYPYYLHTFRRFWDFAVLTCNMWHLTHDMLHVTHDTLHVTHDACHITLCYIFWVPFYQLLSTLGSKLLAAHIKRFSVSHKQNLFWNLTIQKYIYI